MTREEREEIARIFRVELQAALREFSGTACITVLPPVVTDETRARQAAMAGRDKSRQKKALKGIFYE